MMYNDKLIVAVKASGKILREHKDQVHVPFGTEYSLLIKNKNTVRALVTVEIDGVDVTGGTQLIVQPNGSVDLERFIKEGNLDHGNRFKFIERSSKIEKHRGIGAEDGLIRVQFEFEYVHQYQHMMNYVPYPYPYPLPYPGIYQSTTTYTSSLIGGAAAPAVNTVQSTYGSTNVSASGASVASGAMRGGTTTSSLASAARAAPTLASYGDKAPNDAGITVAGSESYQKFVTGSWFPTDGVRHVMILKLLGEVGGKVILEPVTVKTKPVCATCGTTNKAASKFCRECGTAQPL